MLGFKKVNAYIEGKGVIKTDIAIKDGKIFAIGDNLDIDEVIEISPQQVVVPAFIDEHIHGADNFDAMDSSTTALSAMANGLASEGTAIFLATTMTQSKENIIKALSSIKEYIEGNHKNGAMILGVHLEGPFISEKFIGAQAPDYLQTPDIELFDEFNKASGNNIKIVSLAPEVPNGIEFIKQLTDRNIISSVGHSNSGYDDIKKAVSVGLDCVTHTFNAQRPIHHREIGVAGSGLLLDELYTEMICDLTHLSAPAIKLIIKCKPQDKILLVTDSMRAKRLPNGISELGGQKVIVKDGEARLENGALAGSTLKMNIAIKNLVEQCDVDFETAIDYATINPAKHLKIDNLYGSIKENKYANFCVLNQDFSVAKTIREGIEIYSN